MTADYARIDRHSQAYLPSVHGQCRKCCLLKHVEIERSVVNRWLAVRLELAGAFIILVSSAVALAALTTTVRSSVVFGLVCTNLFQLQGVDAGLVGLGMYDGEGLRLWLLNARPLVLSYALNTTGSLNWVVRTVSELETNLTSVERILHLTHVQPEAPAEIPESKPAAQWPERGEIEYRSYR